MEGTEIPGSYRWIFVGGPKDGVMSFNESGAPSTIEGDEHHVYQLQLSPEYPQVIETAPDVVLSLYQWIELEQGADEAGGSWN